MYIPGIKYHLMMVFLELALMSYDLDLYSAAVNFYPRAQGYKFFFHAQPS